MDPRAALGLVLGRHDGGSTDNLAILAKKLASLHSSNSQPPLFRMRWYSFSTPRRPSAGRSNAPGATPDAGRGTERRRRAQGRRGAEKEYHRIRNKGGWEFDECREANFLARVAKVVGTRRRSCGPMRKPQGRSRLHFERRAFAPGGARPGYKTAR